MAILRADGDRGAARGRGKRPRSASPAGRPSDRPCAIRPAPAMILASSAAEAASPFIFQLPATSGRGAMVMTYSLFAGMRLSEPPGCGQWLRPQPIPLELQGVGPISMMPAAPSRPRNQLASPPTHQNVVRAMLRGIHKASSTWLGKAVMGTIMLVLIVISFAIWGIGDIFRGFGRTTVAKIGGTEITHRAVPPNTTTTGCSSSAASCGRPITPDQARALGLDRQFLGQLIAEAALDEQARDSCGSASPTPRSPAASRATRASSGITGQFDRSRFEQVIRDAGFTEARFVAEQRDVTLRRQIALSRQPATRAAEDRARSASTASRTKSAPSTTSRLARRRPATSRRRRRRRSQNISRSAKRCSARRNTARSRCCRSSPAELAKPGRRSRDADAKAYYEQRKARYGTPEKRDICGRSCFPNAEDAKAAADKIAKGTSFERHRQGARAQRQDTDLGIVDQDRHRSIRRSRDAAFALKAGEVSAAGAGPLRHRAVSRSARSSRASSKTLRGGRAADQAGRSRPSARAQQDRRPARQDRGRARRRRDARRDRARSWAQAAHHRRRRPLRPRRRRQAGRRPAARRRRGRVRLCHRRRRRQRAAADAEAAAISGYDVTGITPSRERTLDEVKDQVERAGATTRSPSG